MRFNRFDLNLIVVLDALLNEKNITRAGKRLHLSQSATSGSLARLREYFDDELLVQIGRKMVLTPLGESLVKPVKSLLVQAQSTIEHRPQFDQSKSERRFSFIMSDYTATVLLPDAVRRASLEAPGITFEEIAPTNEPVDELEQGNADFLLLPSNFLSKKHPYTDILKDRFVCLVCQDNPLVGKKISLQQYAELGHVIVQFGSKRRPSVDVFITEKAGIKREPEVVVNTFSSVPYYLIGTKRVATIHERFAKQWMKHFPLKMVPVPLDIPSITWGIQWHQYRDLDPATRWIRNLIIDSAKAL